VNITYSQTTGHIMDEQGNLVATGWAGRGEGKNNPSAQDQHCTGPLPQGIYECGAWHDHPHLGPMVLDLHQVSGDTYGRDAFYVHGPSSKNYGEESMGCIIVPRPGREMVHALLPRRVTVTA